MEMVRMLYQNGDKVLNTVNENNEPFYMQLEALMRRESIEKKIQQQENGLTGVSFLVDLHWLLSLTTIVIFTRLRKQFYFAFHNSAVYIWGI